MTTVAVFADPPRPGLVLPELAATAPVSEAEAADLYAAMLRDVLVAADGASGELLVAYRPDELLPDEHVAGTSSEAAVRAVVADALDDPSAARVEVQVGSTPSARVGNAVTHLLREEGATSVGVVAPTAPLLTRTLVDGAAMKLRSSSVVLGPAPAGRVHYAAFAEPIDFTDALAPPALRTLTASARDADLDVDFVEMRPVVERGEDLPTMLAAVDARRRADRRLPRHTAAALDDLGLELATEVDRATVARTTGGP
ncbi:MAG: hypothetical protein ABEJ61_08575 [Haloferacaceae archaeon]